MTESMEPFNPIADVPYSREHFKTRLPGDRLYTAAHYWLLPDAETGTYRVGLTRFATRMLGELVEFDFEVEPGAAVSVGAVVGWLEGFKATSDLFAVVDGALEETNQALFDNPELLHADPFGDGWLYRGAGDPDPGRVDARGYSDLLDAAINNILEGEVKP